MMEQPSQFRTSLGGFNREDVVRYMEFINNKHAAQVAQLTNELEYLRGKQDTLDANRVSELEKQLSAAQAENDTLKHRIAVLERSLQEATAALAQPTAAVQITPSESELEAYRRAERVERVAKERARQVGHQTADALGKISTQMDDAVSQLSDVSARMMEQLNQLQQAVSGSRQAVQTAAGMAEQLNAEME
ncbi:MAG: hypothetical protein ACI3XG_09640 [Faecousia sp.]